MPAHPFWTSFISGELTDKLDARVDLQRYRQGARCIRNMIVQVHGGAAKRAGTTLVAETKSSGAFQADAFQEDAFDLGTGDTAAILQRFIFSTEQAYMLEMGHEYIRVYAKRTQLQNPPGTPVEISTPYQAEELRELRFDQSADVLYIAHQNHPPMKLLRLTANSFELRTIHFYPPPSDESEVALNATLTLDALSGNAVLVTADNPVFFPSDNGRPITAGPGFGFINQYNSATSVFMITRNDFSSLTLAPGAWTLGGSPQVTYTPSAAGPLNAQITVTAGTDGFRVDDVGKFLPLNGGLVQIIQYVSPTEVVGIIIKVLDDTASSVAGTVPLEAPVWSDALGWPGVVGLFEQRLWFAGSPSKKDTYWGSVTGDYENYAAGVEADDAVTFTVASSEVNLVRWIKALRTMLSGTSGGEFELSGDDRNAITPTSIKVSDESRWGADFNVDAIRVWNVVLFLQRGGRKIRELAFSYEADGYLSPDLTILSEHLVRDGITRMAYLPQPDSTVLAVRTDGVLLGCTYERAEQVVAWHHHQTDGRYVDVATIPNMCGTGDEVWAIVERELPLDDGAFQSDAFQADAFQTQTGSVFERHRYLEVFDGALSSDAALTYSGVPASVLTGLNHLEGKTVVAITRDGPFQLDAFQDDLVQEDGVRFETSVVQGGQVQLSQAAANIEVGLPFEAELELLRPELMTQNGSLQGRRQHYNQVIVRFYCTSGVPLINGERIKYPPGHADPFTGDIPNGPQQGWHRGENRILIEQRDPLPMTVLGVGGAIQWEDG